MQQRGRKGFSGVATVAPLLTWPEPPAHLPAAHQELWRGIVRTRAADYFNADTLPLLEQYVRAIVDARIQAEAIDAIKPEWLADREHLARYKALIDAKAKTAGLINALARAMRLTQQSQWTAKSAATAARKGAAQKMPWEM